MFDSEFTDNILCADLPLASLAAFSKNSWENTDPPEFVASADR